MHSVHFNADFIHGLPKRMPCACCGYESITEQYDICGICGWEFEDDDPENYGPNLYSLREAQVNYGLFGACEECAATGTEKPEEGVFTSPNWKEYAPPLPGSQFHDPDFPAWNLTCPCCGYFTIHGGRERCGICGWFFSPQQQNPDEKRGPNEVSLREAQKNYRAFGAKSELLKPHVRAAGPADQKDAAWVQLRSARGGGLSESTCRCCGYKSVSRPGDECAICGWVDVPEPFNADEKRAPNEVALRQAQRNFRNFGAKSTLAIAHVRRPTDDDQKDPCWRLADEPLPIISTTYHEVGGVKLLDVTCACCGYKAVSAAGWRCEICGWEYYMAHQNPADRSQPNPIKLRQAQRNYREFGASRRELLPREIVLKTVDGGTSPYTIESLRKPLPEDRKDPDWKPLDELD